MDLYSVSVGYDEHDADLIDFLEVDRVCGTSPYDAAKSVYDELDPDDKKCSVLRVQKLNQAGVPYGELHIFDFWRPKQESKDS